MKFSPVPKAVPPVATLYQLNVPAFALALRTTVPESHLLAGTVLVIVGTVLIVATTSVLTEVQLTVDVCT